MHTLSRCERCLFQGFFVLQVSLLNHIKHNGNNKTSFESLKRVKTFKVSAQYFFPWGPEISWRVALQDAFLKDISSYK